MRSLTSQKARFFARILTNLAIVASEYVDHMLPLNCRGIPHILGDTLKEARKAPSMKQMPAIEDVQENLGRDLGPVRSRAFVVVRKPTSELNSPWLYNFTRQSEDGTGKVGAIGGMSVLADDLGAFHAAWMARALPCPSRRSATNDQFNLIQTQWTTAQKDHNSDSSPRYH